MRALLVVDRHPICRKRSHLLEASKQIEMKDFMAIGSIKAFNKRNLYLGRSDWSVRHLIWGGNLPFVRSGRRVHLDVRDMDAYIEQNKVIEDN